MLREQAAAMESSSEEEDSDSDSDVNLCDADSASQSDLGESANESDKDDAPVRKRVRAPPTAAQKVINDILLLFHMV